jgi:antitoxin HicB
VIPAEPNCFHAEIPEFYGCFAQGKTVGEAYDNLELAAETWIETALSQGHEIPPPSSTVDYSGRIVLRLPQGLHQQAAFLAQRNETSLNTFLVAAVANKVGAEDFYGILAERFLDKLVQTMHSMQHTYFQVQANDRTLHQPFKPVKFSGTLAANAATLK